MAPNAFELPRVGSTFADQFEVLEVIGQGGMGVVFRARQVKLQREVALKVLRPSAVAGGYEQFRLEREAVSAARFRSQHVVDIYDWGVSANGLTYLVMELLHGETLAQRFEHQSIIEPAQVAIWLRQCGEALDEASTLGIVHRDIKPGNLFLATTPNGGATEIKILDFGITKVFDPSRATFRHEVTTQSSVRMGTTRYMSPEQLRATSSVDARADVWSLGVVIYQALAGAYPFDRASEADLIVSILSAEPPPLHLVNANLSSTVSQAVARALAKNVDARYRSAGEFARALSAALGQQPAESFVHTLHSTRVGPQRATRLAVTAQATDAGLETRASNDSLHGERDRPRPRASKRLAVIGTAVAVSCAIAVAASRFVSGSLPSNGRPTVVATLQPHVVDGEPDKLPAQSDGAPLVSASAATASVAAQLPPPKSVAAQLPPPKVVSRDSTKVRPLPPATPSRASASARRSAASAPSAHQFERDNPYAN